MTIGSLRPSQVITTFGPGAIVDLKGSSVMIAGIDAWTPRDPLIINEPRLTRALGVTALYQITDGKNHPERRDIVPAIIFPRYMVCTACRLLSTDEWHMDWQSGELRCTYEKCVKPDAVVFPARFVIACERGHIDEFPWRSYVHDTAHPTCNGLLKLEELGRTGTISDVQVSCLKCPSKRSMADAFDPDKRSKLFGNCTGMRPWLIGHETDPQPCTAQPRALLRGASNAYFPMVRSALSIPPWSEMIQEVVGRHERDLLKITSLEDLKTGLKQFFNFPDLDRWSPDEIWHALEIRRGVAKLSVADILKPEWEALIRPDTSNDAEFQTSHAESPADFVHQLSRVVMVRRLKEVRALTAFTRIDSWADLETEQGVPPERQAPLHAENDLDWLPGLLVRGEGIFIQFSESAISKWESRANVVVAERDLASAHAAWRRERKLPPVSAPPHRYVLIHSFSHCLMRQMSLECGYGVSSLRERLYVSAEPHSSMAGVLIYTATPDSDGSLGGLVDLAQNPNVLNSLIRNALSAILVCASDPLCSDNRPGERGMLNGSACHACLLLPETCCERSNRFLDRASLVETMARSQSEFFSTR